MRVSVLASELLRVVSRSRGATVPEGETKTLLLKVLRLKQQKPSAWNRVSSVKMRSVVEVGVKEVVREVPPTFLSVALGPRLIQHNWFNFNLSSPLVLTLTRALAPAILRMGGSAANFLTYDPTLQDFSPHRRDNSVSSFSRDDLGPVQAPQRPPPAAIAPQNVELVREVTGGGVSVESSLHTTTQRAPQPDHTSQNNTHDTKHSDRILPTHHTHHSSSTPHTRLSNLSHRTRHENFTHKEINSLSTDDRHSENKGRGNLFPTDFNSHSNSPSNQSNQDPITSQPRRYPRDVAECSCKTDYGTPTFTNFTMSGTDWRKLTDFAETVGMRLLFDLNQFYRDEDEPNAYKHKFGFSITGQRSAQDYDQLQDELSHYFLPAHSVPIVGPDVTRPKRRGYTDKLSDGLRTFSVDFLREFLSNTRTNLTAVTWHQYYMDGRTAGVKDFLSPDVLDQLVWQVAQMVTVKNQLALGAPLWLSVVLQVMSHRWYPTCYVLQVMSCRWCPTGLVLPAETGSAWGGGASGLSNAYVAGFMWLDKLGVAARGGVDLVARQTLYEGCYAMIDNNLVPNPDYWLSVLYKRLVGGRVLNVSLSQAPITTRLYAHCHNNYSHDYTPGGVVIYGMNLANESSQVALTHHLAHSPILQYLLLPSDGVLQSSPIAGSAIQQHIIGLQYGHYIFDEACRNFRDWRRLE
ncbi:Heparanase-like [Homarus americanus]|uniref:Heparanase-like n=1 Tax=Homarus americanus TaxID=6706 RepID=A0A8J5MTF7_HOMAM|nr:Heparanase-like [Homarus americanus]